MCIGLLISCSDSETTRDTGSGQGDVGTSDKGAKQYLDGGGTCIASSCVGCCQGGSCQPGTSVTSCGVYGAKCSKCKSTEACMGGKCQLSGAGTKVILVSADVTGCGKSDVCDTYVKITVGGVSKKSLTKPNKVKPVWNEHVLTATEADLKKGFALEVMDEDTSADVSIGKCTPAITAAVLSAGKLVTSCGANVKLLTFEFK